MINLDWGSQTAALQWWKIVTDVRKHALITSSLFGSIFLSEQLQINEERQTRTCRSGKRFVGCMGIAKKKKNPEDERLLKQKQW